MAENDERIQEFARNAEEQGKQVLRKLPLLGPIAWLMLQQSATRNILLGELEWRVMPALVLDQARLHVRGDAPLALLTWARLSVEAAARYRLPPHRLAPADWRSGEEIWLVDVIAPYGGGAEAIRELKEKLFPGQTLRQLLPAADQPAQVLTW